MKTKIIAELKKMGIKVENGKVKKRDLLIALDRVHGSVQPSVYVSTYKKYNEGSLRGRWMNLEDYLSKDDFLKAANKLHSDEEDPELMYQDYEGFPKRYYGESGLADELWEWLDLDDKDREILEAYIEATDDQQATIRDAKDNFEGKFDSKKDWATQWVEDVGLTNPEYYIQISDTDKRIIAGEEVDSRLSDMSEKEIIEQASMEEEYEALEEKLEELESNDGEEAEMKKLKKELEKLVDAAKDKITEEEMERIEESLKDPIGYFVDETGMYTKEELMKQPWIGVDYDAFIRDAEINDFTFVEQNGDVLVFRKN